ncbi:MAG TPA: TraR/DksA C4-type zinc finger protein [Burkholderiales bacterium]|nr:TraR/DksA C4-type zinc finger protein [Burkholderiales bacterium]
MSQNSEKLTDRGLSALLAALDERERELRGLVAERRSALDEQGLAADPAGDDADRAFGRVRSAIENDLLDLHLRELARIDAARARAADGRYGMCEDCGEPIPPGRLQANPTALRCAACQGRREKLYAAAP